MAISRENMDLFSFALIYIVSVCVLLRFLARHEGPVQFTQVGSFTWHRHSGTSNLGLTSHSNDGAIEVNQLSQGWKPASSAGIEPTTVGLGVRSLTTWPIRSLKKYGPICCSNGRVIAKSALGFFLHFLQQHSWPQIFGHGCKLAAILCLM